MARDISPTRSVRSIASSHSATLSRPPPPPKPSHLSSAFTGTCNSIALRQYIQIHTTGGSLTEHSPSTATISRAHLGHGYHTSSVDHFVDAFDTSSQDQDDVDRSTTRPPARGRTYTAPSVSRLFNATSDDQGAGEGTTRLIRNEPIAINGTGPSRVGNLRSMFEAALPSTSTPVALSRQNTGIKSQNTGAKAKPRISNQVRMLQAQITGDRFNGITGAFNVADARSSVIVERPSGANGHQRNGTDQSKDTSIYRTATQDLLGDALKMDALVIPPNSNSDTLRPSPSSSYPSLSDAFGTKAVTQEPATMDTDTTISRSTSAKNGLTSSRILHLASQHDRDDSSATIRPSNSNQDVATPSTLSRNGTVAGTARRRSTRMTSGGKKGRLSSIFTASPQSSDRSGQVNGISPSPSGASIASRSASEAESEAGTERSREPSMLLADDDDISFSRSSHHLRANDGSCFDLDWGSNPSPTKAASVRKALRTNAAAKGANALGDSVSSSSNLTASTTPEETEEEATIDANPHPSPRINGEAVSVKADPSPLRPPSIVVDLKTGDSDTQKPDPVAVTEALTHAADSSLKPATASTLHASRPISAQMLRPGIGKPARALYDFEGEAAFNELIIRAGQPFDIVNESLAGGWSLGVVWDENGVPTRGLIPQGWYCLIQDFTRSPPASSGVEPPATLQFAGEDGEDGKLKLPSAAVSPENGQVKDSPGSKLNVASPNQQIGSIEKSQSRVLSSTVNRTSAQTVEQERTPSQGSLDSQDRNTSALTPLSEGPAELEPQTPPVSVSAFLNIGEEAAQWQQVEQSDAKIQTASIRVHEPEGDDAFVGATTAIDGMPAASDEANPIDWSAVAAAQPLTTVDYQTSLTNGSAGHNSERIEQIAAPPGTESTAITSSDWNGSIFGKKTFNRFASFVTSGAEDYVLSNSDHAEHEHSRMVARKVSGGKPVGALVLKEVAEEDETAEARHASVPAQSCDHARIATEVLAKDAAGSAANPNHHFVIAGPAGPKWQSKCSPFLVQVHHPEKRTKLNGMQEYTVYHVTSTYPVERGDDGEAQDNSDSLSGRTGCIPYDPLGGPYPPGAQVTVLRRFTQFEWLHQVLVKHYSALLIPPLPEKQYSGRFASDFIETRRADLEMWISRLVRHPVLRYSEPIRFFLSCEDEAEWRSTAATLLRGGDEAGRGGVFAQTWHPDFNFDSTEAEVEAERMDAFLKTLEKTINGVGGHNAGKHGVLAAYKGHREGHVATSSTYRDLSYTLLRTLTGAGAGSSDGHAHAMGGGGDDAHRIHGPPMGNIGKRSSTGATNEHGVWCWREDCQECLNLTSALQNTAETMQTVADIYEHHSRETLLRQHERFKELSRPHTSAQALLETHRTTLARYREATGEVDPAEDQRGSANLSPAEAERVASRCETVLNVTLSEMDRLHSERVQDYHALGRALLDGEIELYESILEQLKAARLHFEEEYYEREEGMHILPSRYQAELGRAKKPTAPLLMPSAPPGGGVGLGLGRVGGLIAQATGTGGGGVIRPASMGVEEQGEAGVGRDGGDGRKSGSYFGAIWR